MKSFFLHKKVSASLNHPDSESAHLDAVIHGCDDL